ncbi:hypothetical protein DVH24_010424 [Malus domestica]|uniref:Uncharacterized protein n=1 Tax=Malus domestica TaxID=3750 RepID=A0A498JQ79_MALDO|nr:hypothetical protein DVH24_010424 [Malus domestica]
MLMKLKSSHKIDKNPDEQPYCFKPKAEEVSEANIVQFFSSVFTTDKAKTPNTKNKKMISIS